MESFGIEQAIRAAVQEAIREAVAPLLAEIRNNRHPQSERDSCPALLTTAEAAARSRVHEATIRSWVKQGHLSRRFAGRELRIDREELDAFLARGRCSKKDEPFDPERKASEILAKARSKRDS